MNSVGFSKLKIGFIGCGLIARAHARSLGDSKRAEIVAAFDPDGSKAQHFADRFAPGVKLVSSAADVIEAAEAVYVCTWTSAHSELVLAAAAKGRHVFCEKPLATNLEDAQKMADAVRDAGVVGQVGLVLRYAPACRWIKNEVESIERVLSVTFRSDQYIPVQGMYNSTWRGDSALAGSGVLLEHSIHDLDLLQWFVGPITKVAAISGNYHANSGIEDHLSAIMQTARGTQVQLTTVWHDVLSRPSQRRVEVFGADTYLELDGYVSGPVGVEAKGSDLMRLEGAALTEAAKQFDPRPLNQDVAFVDAALDGLDPYPDFEVAVDAHKVVDALYTSAAQGDWVDVEP